MSDSHEDLLKKDFESLSYQITNLSVTANLLEERLDSIQALLDQGHFSLDRKPIRVNPNRTAAAATRQLLGELHLTEENLQVGEFLRALNRYLIANNLVNQNDLQIHLTPLLAVVFEKSLSLGKVPQGMLLFSLPKLFV